VTGDFGAIEGVVGVVGAAALGGALAVRIYLGPPGPKAGGLLARSAPVLVGLGVLLAVGAVLRGTGRGFDFLEGLVAGALAAFAVAALESPGEPGGPGPIERPPAVYRALAGCGAGGAALLAVLAVLLTAGSGPVALFGVPVGAGTVLLLGEPSDRWNGRLRLVAVVAALSAATASVAGSVVVRAIVPDALLLPLLFGAASTGAATVGVVVDHVGGSFRLGVPAAIVAGVLFSSAAVAEWMPGKPAIALAVVAGWLGVGTAAYLPRWAVLEPSEAKETASAGTALGVLAALSGGLRAVGAAVLGFGVALWIAFEAGGLLVPDGTFGVALAAATAAVGAAGVALVRVGVGPHGSPRVNPESLDVAAVGWAGLAIVFALPLSVPALTGIPSEVFASQLGLGSPATLAGLVVGAVLPFLLASSSRTFGLLRRWGAALAPAVVAIAMVLAFGPSIAVALVLGAMLTGTPLGFFWAAARESAASVSAESPVGSRIRPDLASSMDPETGWRLSAAVLATSVAVLAVIVVAVRATGHFGL
jgi:hypothetical protein